jgi:hypothetical protein
MGSKRSIISIHKKIEKDRAKTEAANAPGGRYWKPGVANKIAAITGRKYR